MNDSDLTPDIPHNPALRLEGEPVLASPTAAFSGASSPSDPAEPSDGFKKEIEAIVLDFLRKRLA